MNKAGTDLFLQHSHFALRRRCVATIEGVTLSTYLSHVQGAKRYVLSLWSRHRRVGLPLRNVLSWCVHEDVFTITHNNMHTLESSFIMT